MNNQLNILVVDDDELARDLLDLLLRKRFNVYTVGSVSSFYEIINKVKFDMILMDVSLCDSKDGIQLTAELRQDEKHKNTPIVMVSAFGTTKIISDALNAGATKYVIKPVTREILDTQILTLLNSGSESKKAC